MTPGLLEQLEEMERKATVPGWSVGLHDDDCKTAPLDCLWGPDRKTCLHDFEGALGFVAVLRNVAPELFTEIRRLQAENAKLRTQTEEADTHHLTPKPETSAALREQLGFPEVTKEDGERNLEENLDGLTPKLVK